MNVGYEFPVDKFQVLSGRVFRARSSLQELRKASGHRQGAREVDHEPTTFKRNTEAVLCYDFSNFAMFSSIVCSD